MTRSRRSAAVMAGVAALLLSACQPWAGKASQREGKAAVAVVYSGAHCGRREATPRASWIDDARQLEASLRHIRADRLGGQPASLPNLDFRHEIGLLVEMGQRPTLGYRLTLGEDEELHISQGRAHLSLNWVQPPADAIVAQALSSPCLLLKLERGDYTSVQVLDTQGALKAEAR